MLQKRFENEVEYASLVGSVEEPLPVFYGTGDLEGVIRSKRVNSFSSLYDLYEKHKERYNYLTKEFARRVRECPSPETEFLGRFNELFWEEDAALADLVETFGGFASPYERRCYRELKRGLFVCCFDNLYEAIRHANPKRESDLGGVVEAKISRNMMRHGRLYILGNMEIVEVSNVISSEDWTRMHVPKPDFERTIRLLDEYGLEEIPVSRLG